MTRAPAPAVQVFDLRGEPHQLRRDEWTRFVERDPAELRGVVLHQWAAKSVGTMGHHRARYGEPLALARRGLATPYAISCGVTALGGVPVVAVCHPLERYTYSSDAGNAHYLSIGVMGLFPYVEGQRSEQRHTPPSVALLAAVSRALEVAAELLDEAGCGGDLKVITHRQCANGPSDHFACPGEAVVEIAALALRDGAAGVSLSLDPDLVLLPKFGRPWPPEWRRHLRTDQPKLLATQAAPVDRGVGGQHGADPEVG